MVQRDKKNSTVFNKLLVSECGLVWKLLLKIFLSIFFIIFVYMGVFVYVCAHACSAYGGQKRVLNSLGIGVTDSCEPPYGCWELILGPLEDRQMFLTA